MKDSYKSAMSKITVDDATKQRILNGAINQSQYKKPVLWRSLSFASAVAAVLILTVVAVYYTNPLILNRFNDIDLETYEYTGYSTICVAQNMSYRDADMTDRIYYDTKISFKFVGFEKYGINIDQSSILFNTTLGSKYTLTNFFDDYYKLIVSQRAGMSDIVDGNIHSLFNIEGDYKIYLDDGKRVITNLDTTLLSDYQDMDEIVFTITIK